ncbi:hypothetical protein LguiA_020310 [Lonicera macranthoides]
MGVNMESIIEEPPELPSDVGDNFGDPEILPRVGDQYQVDIPPLMMDHDDLELIRKWTDPKVTTDVRNYFTVGLPIPIMWVHNEVGRVKETASKVHCNKNQAADDSSEVESENSEDSQITSNNEDAQLKFDNGESGYSFVPGSLGEAWSEIEYESFLLALYIFRKNFNFVKKFVESKEMGDLLGYYYGKFYRSGEYITWSEGQKIRSKRCIHGQKIFTGWRLQELLSRLFSQVSLECKHKLTEVSRTFGEGKLSLEEYVFALKDNVGINKLVAAVAIGKGKQDLTSTTIDPTKSNNPACHIRPEIPSGKAWSSLTSSEIIKFLTGDFRLSKAKSQDLFWEAVWPRLLARGWHSEQPRDHIYARSKNSLVFLIPGVKKFSRRKLVKKNDYFDSVTDVLNKVAAEPSLIELDFEAAKLSPREENDGSSQDLMKDLEKSNEQRHCYLQPRNSNCNQDLMFTIVDTSLVTGEERVKVRELRSLPIDLINMSTTSSFSSEDSQHEVKENNTSSSIKNENESSPFVDSTECMASIVDNHLVDRQDPTIPTEKNYEDRRSTSLSTDRSSTAVKFQFHRKVKSHRSNYLVPIAKHCKLTACTHRESHHRVENSSVDAKLKREELLPSSNSPNTCEEMTSIDVNLPHIPAENISGTNETSENIDVSGTKSSLLCGASTEQNIVNGRRHSTRNRPLTTRALEALECEFLVPKKKRKGNAESMSQNKSLSIYSRRVRAKNAADSTHMRAKNDVNKTPNAGVDYDAGSCKMEKG